MTILTKKSTMTLATALALGVAAWVGISVATSDAARASTTPPAAAEQMRVFSEPTVAPVPFGITASIEQGLGLHEPEKIPAGMYPGDLLGDSAARVLIDGQGSRTFSLYAIPTSTDQVCFEDSLGTGGCVPAFSEESPVLYNVNRPGESGDVMLYGISPDEVVSVEVTSDDGTVEAALENNAYFWEGANTPSEMRLTYEDGSDRVVSLPSADAYPPIPENRR